jgi:hypothetical protein
MCHAWAWQGSTNILNGCVKKVCSQMISLLFVLLLLLQCVQLLPTFFFSMCSDKWNVPIYIIQLSVNMHGGKTSTKICSLTLISQVTGGLISMLSLAIAAGAVALYLMVKMVKCTCFECCVFACRSAARQGGFGLEHKDEDCCRDSKRVGVPA